MFGFGFVIPRTVSCCCIGWCFRAVRWTEHFDHHIPQIKSWDSVHSQTSIQIKIFGSVELWDTDVCFLHIQLMRTNVGVPKINKIHPEIDFECSRSPAKSESQSAVFCSITDMTILFVITCVMMYEINLADRLSQAPVNLVTERASLFTDQRMSGLPIHAKHKHFKTICEHTLDNSPTDSSSSFLKWRSSKQGLETVFNWSVFLFASSQSLSTHFWACPSCRKNHATVFARGSHPCNFPLLQQKLVSRTLLCSPWLQFHAVYINFECVPNFRDREMKLARLDPHFSSMSSTLEPYSAFLGPFLCYPHEPIRIIFSVDK